MTEPQNEYISDAMEMLGITEPKQIITTVSGFIPVFEVVMQEYDDYMTALVFGRIWQYCGMSDGVCRASIDRIARDLKMSGATIMRHIERLETGGYIYDTTPDRRNRPHEYVDCGKVVMKGSLHAGIAQKNSGIAQKNVTIAQSQLIKQYNTTIKQVNDNDEKTEIDRRTAILSTLYSNNIGAITPMIADILKDIAETYPDEIWYKPAFEIAVKNNARNLAYIETVLRNWRDKGRDWAPKMSYSKQGNLQQTPTLEEALAKAGYQ